MLAVALLYRILAPRFGVIAGLLGAFALAVFPSFVAVSRDNGVDPLLILLMLASCGAALAAIDSGRLRTLVWCGVLAGLAFNTKSLAALLCVPGIGLGYLVCAPGSWRRRLAQLAAAGAVFVAVAVSWSLAVDLTPASQRPYVGGSATNSEFQLEFGYNGFGRVGGQQGGPGSTDAPLTAAQLVPLVRPGVDVAPSAAERRYFAAHRVRTGPKARASGSPRRPAADAGGSRSRPVRRHAQPGADLRHGARRPGGLARAARADRDAGARANAAPAPRPPPGRAASCSAAGSSSSSSCSTSRPASCTPTTPRRSARASPRWSAPAPSRSASLVRRPGARRALRGYLLAIAAVAATAVVQLVLIDREGDPLWWRIPLVVLCLGGLIADPAAARARRLGARGGASARCSSRRPSTASASGSRPVDGTFPTAGPYSHAGYGGLGVSADRLGADRGLVRYIDGHTPARALPAADAVLRPGGAADPARPARLAEGGYGASDPALGNAELAALVAERAGRATC